MAKNILKEDYFGTLMSNLVDQSRELLKTMGKTFNPTPEAYKIQNDMCVSGDYLKLLPIDMIIQTTPQKEVVEAEKKCLPRYRNNAIKLIKHFMKSCVDQGGDTKKVELFFKEKYTWNK